MIRHNLVRIMSNPIVIVVPIVCGLLWGWNHYLFITQQLDIPQDNLLPFSQFTQSDRAGVPKGWQIDNQGKLAYALSRSEGHVQGDTLDVTISHYKSGTLSLRSPIINVTSGQSYFYKGYYAATNGFDVAMQYYYRDNTSKLIYADSYPATSLTSWSTASAAIKDQNVKAVQIVYHLHGNGAVRLSGNYLEPREANMYDIQSARMDAANIIPNANLARSYNDNTGTLNDDPDDWEPILHGDNDATFGSSEGQHAALDVHVSHYKNGEAGWHFLPQTVKPGMKFDFSFDYQATAPTTLNAEYELDDGSFQFQTATLPPSSEWLHISHVFEAPKQANHIVVQASLHQNGTLQTKNYLLKDSTKSGPSFFDHPLISLTFDDNWSSTFQYASPLLARYAYKGTFYVNPLTLDTKQYMTTSNMQSLLRAGNEIASHGLKHINFTTVNRTEASFELSSAARFIQQQTGVRHGDFATPFGESDAGVDAAIKRFYQSNRGTQDGVNTRQNFDPYNLQVLFVSSATTPSQIQQAIAEAKRYNAWLILVYHQVQYTQAPDAITPEDFNSQLQIIKTSGLQVRTVAAALQELYPQL